MGHMCRLAAFAAALCVFCSISSGDAGALGTSAPRVEKEPGRTGVQTHVDSSAPVAAGGGKQHGSLSAGLQALLAYNAARGEFYAAPADTTTKKEEKKEQVPKDGRTYDAQSKDGKAEPHAEAEVQEKDEGFWDSCVVGCMGAIGESLCDAVFGGDSEIKAVVAGGGTVVTTAPGGAAMTTPEAFPYEGLVKPLAEGGNDVNMWETPGGDSTQTGVVETLPAGARVTVMEDVEVGYGVWVRVKRISADSKTGWIRQEEVIPAVMAPGATTPAVTSETLMIETEPTRGIGESRGQVCLGMLYPVFSEQVLRDEYGKNAWRLRAESRFMLAHSIQVGGSFGYLRSNGEPQFNYVGETTVDTPVNSTLEIWDIGMEVGQLLPFAGGKGFFVYGVGPSVFNVREQADIDVIESGLVIDTRTDELSEWKFGGEIELGIGGLANDRFPIGFQARFLVIPWESTKEKSLTLDYLDKDAIFAYSFGVTVGVVFF